MTGNSSNDKDNSFKPKQFSKYMAANKTKRTKTKHVLKYHDIISEYIQHKMLSVIDYCPNFQ